MFKNRHATLAYMGRTREFDAGVVLEQATRLFWTRGYDAVTIQDLEEATGVGRGSLYHAFEDKEGVFIAAFDSYVAKYAAAPFEHLAHPDVEEGLRRMFATIIARMVDPRNPRGCLLTNTTLVARGGEGRIETKLAALMTDMETQLEAAIARAKRERQIEPDADPRSLARFYCAVSQSLSVEHKVFGDRAALHDIVANAMRAWPRRKTRRRRAS